MKMRKIVLLNSFSCRCLLAWISAAKNEQQQDPVSKVSKTNTIFLFTSKFVFLRNKFTNYYKLQISKMILTHHSGHFYLILYMFPKQENPHISLKRNKYKLTQNRKKTQFSECCRDLLCHYRKSKVMSLPKEVQYRYSDKVLKQGLPIFMCGRCLLQLVNQTPWR